MEKFRGTFYFFSGHRNRPGAKIEFFCADYNWRRKFFNERTMRNNAPSVPRSLFEKRLLESKGESYSSLDDKYGPSSWTENYDGEVTIVPDEDWGGWRYKIVDLTIL